MDTSRHGPRAFRHADCIDRAHPQRAEVEAFIQDIYAARFDARPPALMPHLLAFRDADGELLAAVGLRCAIEGPLFVERYLGAPVERVLAERLGHMPPRAEVVEIGNFAAATPGAARALILSLIPLLRGAGLRWTLFAATRQLRNAFARLGLDPRFLCRAQAEALGEEGGAWGRYYETDPEVLFGDLDGARVSLPESTATATPREAPALPRSALGCGAPA